MKFDPVDFVRQSVEGKIDSRMKTPTETHPIYALERTYCALCGKKKGYVSQESSKYIKANNIIVVCDDCDRELGQLPLEKANITEVNLND